MTNREAKKWAIKKWTWIVKHGEEYDFGGIVSEAIKAIPELRDFMFGCSYCQIYYTNHECIGCPIAKKTGKTCLYPDSAHSVWSREPTKANAQKMLAMVRKT